MRRTTALTRLLAQSTGHKAVRSFGAAGKGYAQINNGAPLQIQLSADNTSPSGWSALPAQ